MAFEILNNRYEVIEKIGEGGMGVVYKAKDNLLNRFVAVKILKGEFSNNREFLEKFKREATAAASLSDTHIVNIYDIGTDREVSYIVMEYIQGKTLKEIIKENGIIKQDIAVKIVIQIAKALDCAHSHGIIHRDIKPHNIMINENGIVKVTDFGIAKASTSYTITNTKEIIGSAHYFSPEQARGSFVDFRTDIYSLGIVMYEMVTGSLPYDGDSPVSIALKHLQEKVIEPKFLNENISEGLNNVILKAIQKDSAYRYDNAKEMLKDLKKLDINPDTLIEFKDERLDETRIMKPVNAEKTEKKVKKKNNKKALLLSLLLIAVLLGVFFTFKYFFYGNAGKGQVQIPNVLGMDTKTGQTELEKLGLVFVYDSDISSNEYEKGKIAKMSPEAGLSVKKGTEVKIYLSSGKEEVSVPDVRNIYIDSAKEILVNYGLKVGNVTSGFSDTVPVNNVISQSLEPKSSAEKETPVDLVVSKGQEVTLIKVGKFTGKTITEAKASIVASGLTLGKAETIETSDKNLDNIVFSQDIAENAEVAKGQTINITYYTYKEQTFRVLNFKDKTYGSIINNEMEAMLEQGFTFKILDEKGKEIKGNVPEDVKIISQNPDPDTVVSKPSQITLTLNVK